MHAIGSGQRDDIKRKSRRSFGSHNELAGTAAARESDVIDYFGVNVIATFDRLKQALPHIGAEQVPRQKAVGEAFMQAGIILALIELRERPVQEIVGAIRVDGKIPGSDVQKMQGPVSTKRHTLPQGRSRFHDCEAERLSEPPQARDRRRGPGKPAADHANMGVRTIHDIPLDRFRPCGGVGKNRRP